MRSRNPVSSTTGDINRPKNQQNSVNKNQSTSPQTPLCEPILTRWSAADRNRAGWGGMGVTVGANPHTITRRHGNTADHGQPDSHCVSQSSQTEDLLQRSASPTAPTASPREPANPKGISPAATPRSSSVAESTPTGHSTHTTLALTTPTLTAVRSPSPRSSSR
jgi:hypothetical protein